MSAGHHIEDALQNLAFTGRYEVFREGFFTSTTPLGTLQDWSDPSHPNNAVQAVAGKQPQWVVASIPGFPDVAALVFDGVDDFLMTSSVPSMNNTDIREYWIVVRWDSQVPGTFPCAISGDNTAASAIGDLFIYGGVSNQTLLRFSFAATVQVQEAPSVPIDFYMMSICGDGTNVLCNVGPGLTLGGAPILASTDAQATDQPNGTYKLMLGAAIQGAPNLFFNGKLAAILTRNVVSSAADKVRIRAYISRYYGVQP